MKMTGKQLKKMVMSVPDECEVHIVVRTGQRKKHIRNIEMNYQLKCSVTDSIAHNEIDIDGHHELIIDVL